MDQEIQELKATTIEILLNLIKRIDDLYELCTAGDEIIYDRIIFFIDDLKDAAEAIHILGQGVFDLEELNNHLTMLVEAVSNQDTMLMGDVLLFELKPLLQQWQENLS